MKKATLIVLAVAISLAATFASAADVAGWNSFIIRNSNVGNLPPIIMDVDHSGQDAKRFVINEGGMKAGWGTDNLNGLTIAEVTMLFIDRLDDLTRFADRSGPQVAPYFNIWVTDGNGNYAVLANEPSNYDAGFSWDVDNAKLLTLGAKVYENADISWIEALDVGDDDIYTFEELSSLVIESPPVALLDTGWAGLGSGAPRELGTNVAYGFTWVFGDTLTNYDTDGIGYIVATPTAEPAPATSSNNGGCFIQQVAQ